MPKQGQKIEVHGPYEMLLALLAYDYGITPKEICEFYNISNSTLFRWIEKCKQDVDRFKHLLTRVSMDGLPEGNPITWPS